MADDILPLSLVGGQVRTQHRWCTQCGKSKPITEFEKRTATRRRRICKECVNLNNRREWEENPDRKAYQDEWRKANLDKISAYSKRSYEKARTDLKRWFSKGLTTTRGYCKRKGDAFDLTADYLVELFNSQNGLCALTGRVMLYGSEGVQRDSVSIDRIDHEGGYVIGNVRLVTYQANAARNRFSDDELFAFCEAVLAVRDAHEPNDAPTTPAEERAAARRDPRQVWLPLGEEAAP
jgi:hypothetical protein